MRAINPPNSQFAVIGETDDGGNALSGFSTLSLTNPTFQQYWPLSNGPSEIKNNVTIDDLPSVNPSSYSETLGQLPVITTTNIRHNPNLESSYSGETNIEHIYEPEQVSNEPPNRYLKNVSYSLKKRVTNGQTTGSYMEVSFTDNISNRQSLMTQEAYIVNIFRKGSGTDAASQWSNNGVTGFKYVSKDNKGATIASNAVTGLNTDSLAIRLFVGGTVSVIAQSGSETPPTGEIGSSDPGAYLIVVRRSERIIAGSEDGSEDSTEELPYYTISSGFVFIAPTTLTLGSDLKLRTPIYGSYDSTNTLNISVTPFVTLEGVEDPEPFVVSSNIAGTPRKIGNNVEIDIDENALKTAYPDSGPIVTAVRVTYDWSAPSSFDLDIGKINSEFNNVPTVLTTTNNKWWYKVAANQAVSNDVRIPMPSNNYWNYEQGNIVRDARADFIGDANNRLLAIRWEDVKPSDLQSDSLATHFVCIKKQATGYPANADSSLQWARYIYGQYDRTRTEKLDIAVKSHISIRVSSITSQQTFRATRKKRALRQERLLWRNVSLLRKTDARTIYAGVAVRDTYLSESDLPRNALNKSIMYIYVDRDGHIWYNSPPTKLKTQANIVHLQMLTTQVGMCLSSKEILS